MKSATSTLAMVLVLIAGCATAPNYDADAKESLARVVAKDPAGTKRQSTSNSPGLGVGMAVAGGAVGAVVGAAVDSLINTGEVKVFDYTLLTEDGRTVVIRSENFAMQVGNCVKLFESSRPSYPRMAPYSGCK